MQGNVHILWRRPPASFSVVMTAWLRTGDLMTDVRVLEPMVGARKKLSLLQPGHESNQLHDSQGVGGFAELARP